MNGMGMAVRLKPEHYALVGALFAKLRYNLVVDSMIDGNTPAWVYVDHLAAPTAGLMWNRQDAILLAGIFGGAGIDRTLGGIIRKEIIPEAQRRGIPQLALQYTPKAWEKYLPTLMGDLDYRYAQRRFYATSKVKYDWRAHLPPGLQVRPINRALLKDQEIANAADIAGWVRSFWHSEKHFLDGGFGYYLSRGGAALSWCLSVYASGSHYELGVATALEHRGRGYATIVAAACVEHCDRRGWTPHWHCWEDNRASIAVAQKAGFGNPMGYRVVRIQVPSGG